MSRERRLAVHLGERVESRFRDEEEIENVGDLKGDLASLRIDRAAPARASRWPAYLFGVILIGLAALYVLRARQALGAVEVAATRASVVQAAHSGSGSALLAASGYLVARRKAVVSAKIQGRLAELRVEEGSRVQSGQLLARLESADYEAQLQRAQAGVTRAEADLAESERQLRLSRDLARQQIVSNDTLEAAESRVRLAAASLTVARADVAFAQAQLANTRILAPFSGTVVKKMAEVGESVAPIPPGVNLSTSSGAVVALADLDTLEVETDVSESNVAKLGADQPAVVTVEAFPDRRYRAILRQIIPTADRTKATVQVKVTLLEKDRDLRPEMSAKVEFQEATRPSAGGAPPAPQVVVPADAVVERAGNKVVFEIVDSESRVRQRAVKTGALRQGQLLVTEGLLGSEMLVARPPESLRDGDAVRIKR